MKKPSPDVEALCRNLLSNHPEACLWLLRCLQNADPEQEVFLNTVVIIRIPPHRLTRFSAWWFFNQPIPAIFKLLTDELVEGWRVIELQLSILDLDTRPPRLRRHKPVPVAA